MADEIRVTDITRDSLLVSVKRWAQDEVFITGLGNQRYPHWYRQKRQLIRPPPRR